MFEAKEHEGRFGTFYSEWAFSDMERSAPKLNREVLDEYRKALSYRVIYGDNFEHKRPEFTGDDELILRESICFGRNVYEVIEKPEWMTMAEVALVADTGNLCFGFASNSNSVTVYTD